MPPPQIWLPCRKAPPESTTHPACTAPPSLHTAAFRRNRQVRRTRDTAPSTSKQGTELYLQLKQGSHPGNIARHEQLCQKRDIPEDFFGAFSRQMIMPAPNSISALSPGCSSTGRRGLSGVRPSRCCTSGGNRSAACRRSAQQRQWLRRPGVAVVNPTWFKEH